MYSSNKYIYMPPKTPMEPEEWIPRIRKVFSPSGDSWMYPESQRGKIPIETTYSGYVLGY